MASNQSRAKAKAKQAELENDPDYVPPKKETDPGKIVEATIKNIKKEGNVTFFRPKNQDKELRSVLSTGVWAVDHHILGAGGLPQGRIVEIFGAPSGGKGTLCSQIVAETQRKYTKNEIAYIDAECALDYTYASALGVDTDNLLVCQPECGEDALQATIDIISTGTVKLAVVDSVAALVPRAELDGSMADAHMGLAARMMGQGLRKLTNLVSRTGTCLIFINQTRSNLGITFGNPTTTPGGKALTFFSSVRLSIDRISMFKEGTENIGNVTKIKAVKNKTSKPFQEYNINLLFDLPGFDSMGSMVDLAIQHGVWAKDGSKYTLASTGECVTGRKALRSTLIGDEIARKITEESTLVAMGKTPEYIERVLKG
jgi:recombination protein RecA